MHTYLLSIVLSFYLVLKVLALVVTWTYNTQPIQKP